MGKYNHLEIESKYQQKWKQDQTYAYETSCDKKDFVIDTPPPTVSGALHIGHIFSYTQTDIMARFKRMSGYNVFYPMGWDDNGLPTERRVQNLYAIQCDPKLDYIPNFQAEKTKSKRPIYKAISRKNFLEICKQQVLEDEVKYKALWNHMALSVDWSHNYQTIQPESQILSQHSFIDLYNKGLVENRLSPVLWDTQFQTAVAQADVEDREKQTFYIDILFEMEQGKSFVISTTRPELLAACVAVVAHPEDERYKSLFGKQALIPLFKRQVPILASTHADPQKGTGILMVCTFGDMEDVTYCKKQKLPTLQMINEQGFLMDIDFTQGCFKSKEPQQAHSNYSHIKGLRVTQARKKIVELLKENNYLKGEPKPKQHSVKFYEKGDFPLEILPKRQWYIKILDHKQEFLKKADQICWHPASMKKRYQQWVEGLNQDWCISRQRVYGVPFPVWYPLNEEGHADYNKPLIPNQLEQAIDPLKQAPMGFTEEQRNLPGAFKADSDVMDTWATSSLTPFINSQWIFNKQRHQKLFPADLRPQAHEIIRTWAFYTIAKAHFHEQQIPWKNIAISGWVLTPDRMKMSKSKGNALTPENLITTYSADAVRYWTAKASLGQDTLYDENLFKIGQRLVSKIYNASQFVKLQLATHKWESFETCIQSITEPIDQAWLIALIELKKQALDDLSNYQHQKALQEIEKQFWVFCDYYLEWVKARVYQMKDQKEGLSGMATLDASLFLFLKLFSAYLPYVTEHIWQNRYSVQSNSLHSSVYLKKELLEKISTNLTDSFFKHKILLENKLVGTPNKALLVDSMLQTAFYILRQVRKQKSLAGKSLASSLSNLELSLNSQQALLFTLYKKDLCRASHVNTTSVFLKELSSLEELALVKISLQS